MNKGGDRSNWHETQRRSKTGSRISRRRRSRPQCQSCPACVFCSRPDQLWPGLETVAPIRSFPRGKLLFAEGQSVTELIILCGGHVRLYFLTAEGKEVTVTWVGPGALIGCTGLFARTQYDLSCVAVEECYVRRLSLSKLRRLAEQDPSLYERLLAYICRAHYELRREPGEILGKVPQRIRLARLIWHLDSSAETGTGPDGRLGLSVEKLASRLGLSRRTVTELLTELKQEKIVEGRGAKIRVLDAEALKKQCDLDE